MTPTQWLTKRSIGWGRKLSYIIAFSIDGATDVTRRYVRNAATHGRERARAPEPVLMWITNEIRRQRRENMPKEERMRLIVEDEREDKELRNYVVQALAASIGTMLPTSPTAQGTQEVVGAGQSGGENKVTTRRNGAEVWRQARADEGGPPAEQHQPPREGH